MRSLLLAFILCLIVPVVADGQWIRTTGPSGGAIASLASSDSSCFAATAAGLYRSTDGGDTWNPLASPIAEITAMTAFDRSVIIGGSEGRVFRSDDDGTTWTAVQGGFPVARTAAIFRRSTLIFIGFFDEFGKGRSGLFGSFDGGAGWMKIVSGIDEDSPYFSIAGGDTSLFIAGDGGLFRSMTNGTDWSGPFLQSAQLVAVDGKHIAAATFDKVYFSANNGDAWNVAPTGFPEGTGINSLIYHRGILFCGTISGLFRSTDHGETWGLASTGISNSSVSTFAAIGDTLLAGSAGGGVHRSIDSGATWSISSEGIIESTVSSLLPAGGDLFAGTAGGVYRSQDGGDTWSYSGLRDRIPALAVFGGAILAGTQDSGIYRSTDRGVTWTRSDTGLSDRAHHVRSLLTVEDDIYAGTLEGIWRSTDGGLHWTRSSAGTEGQIVPANALAHSAGDLYAGFGGFIFNGVVGSIYRNNDRGGTWLWRGLEGHWITSLAASYPYVWAGGALGRLDDGQELYRSSDRGETWTRAPFAPNPGPHGVSAIRFVSTNLVIGTDIGVFRLTDDGVIWQALNDGFGSNLDVTSLTSEAETLYAGIAGGGVWKRNGLSSSVDEPGKAHEEHVSLWPNPAGAEIIVRYRMERAGKVTIELRDLFGRRVGQMVAQSGEPGDHMTTLDLGPLPQGAYYCTVATPDGVSSIPLTVLR